MGLYVFERITDIIDIIGPLARLWTQLFCYIRHLYTSVLSLSAGALRSPTLTPFSSENFRTESLVNTRFGD